MDVPLHRSVCYLVLTIAEISFEVWKELTKSVHIDYLHHQASHRARRIRSPRNLAFFPSRGATSICFLPMLPNDEFMLRRYTVFCEINPQRRRLSIILAAVVLFSHRLPTSSLSESIRSRRGYSAALEPIWPIVRAKEFPHAQALKRAQVPNDFRAQRLAVT
jgi:hypothetical protein